MNLPNKITLSRIALAFVFVICVSFPGFLPKICALGVFIVAAASDFLDGFIAKRKGMISDFGKIMDPVADKILTLSAFVAFVEMKIIPAWMVAVIILRELIITSIRLKALANSDVLYAGRGGKHKTFSQMTSILFILFFLVLREGGKSMFPFWSAIVEQKFLAIILLLMSVTVFLTLVSAFSYLAGNSKYLFGDRNT